GRTGRGCSWILGARTICWCGARIRYRSSRSPTPSARICWRWWRDAAPSAMRRLSVLAAMLGAGVLALAAHSRAADFDQIKAAAAREGTLTVWHNTPKQETTDALAALF